MTSRNLELYFKNHIDLHQKWGVVLAFEEMRRLALKIEAAKKAATPEVLPKIQVKL